MERHTDKLEVLLDINNIEVIYNHVILVLKGVSLALIESTDEEKMLHIVIKTWAKMGASGQKVAAQLKYSEQAAAVLKKALA